VRERQICFTRSVFGLFAIAVAPLDHLFQLALQCSDLFTNFLNFVLTRFFFVAPFFPSRCHETIFARDSVRNTGEGFDLMATVLAHGKFKLPEGAFQGFTEACGRGR
jgi:hypothetical protein